MLRQTTTLLLVGRHISCSIDGFKRSFISHECNMLNKYGTFHDRIHWRSVVTTNTLREEDITKCHRVTFIKRNGERIEAKGKEGDTLLDIVVNNNLDFDGFGACEGTLTCSTCHVILKKEDYDKLPDKPGDEEMDMLDLAYELTDTSRLGCQITLCKALDGLEVQLPTSINDARN